MELDRYQQDNEANWSDRARVHAESDVYGLCRYAENPGFVNDVVGFDAPLLGDITGLSAVHLQCHIGTDTVSLARLGAAETAGLDFSETAIKVARKLSTDSGNPDRFPSRQCVRRSRSTGPNF